MVTAEVAPLYGTIPDAARRIGVPVKRLRRAVKTGELRCYVLPESRRRRVRFAEVEAWLRSGVVTAPTAHARARVAEVMRTERTGRP